MKGSQITQIYNDNAKSLVLLLVFFLNFLNNVPINLPPLFVIPPPLSNFTF